MEAGTTVQRQLSEYLQYELYHILGAYGIAEKCHHKLAMELKELASKTVKRQVAEREPNPHASPPPDKLAVLAEYASRHNWQLSYHRHGRPEIRQTKEAARSVEDSPENGPACWPFREPTPEDLPFTKVNRFRLAELRGVKDDRESPWTDSEIWERIPKFYSEAIRGLETWEPRSPSKDAQRKPEHVLADSIITQLDHIASNLDEEQSLVGRRLQRYRYRRRCAHRILGLHRSSSGEERADRDPSDPAGLNSLYVPDSDFRSQLYGHNLSTGGDSLSLFVVCVLAEAHLSMHAVEAWQRMCLGERADAYTAEVDEWLDRELERCIELNTFAYCISRTAPWLFAADEYESGKVFEDSALAWEHARPARGMWIAGQVGLLALHRRAYARAMRGERELAYNDYHKLQRLIRDAERRVRIAPIQVDGALEFLAALDAQAHHHIGDLYRAENAHRAARKHFNIAFHRLKALRKQGKLSDVLLNSRCSVELLVSYGKACYELGHHKEALCWHLRGWRDFLHLLAADTETVTNTEAVQHAIEWLERVRYEPEMRKSELVQHVGLVVEQLERVTISKRYGVLAGEILLRLGHLLLVLNLGGEPQLRADAAAESSTGNTLAFACLRRARECDDYSTMIIADLLKAGARLEKAYQGEPPIDTQAMCESLPSVGQLWPRGGSDFERLARAAEYLTLRRQRMSQATAGSAEAGSRAQIAHGLLFDFFMNTDSINVRKSQGYSLLMQKGRPSRLPSGADVAIEFICMRRYSSFFPLLPRPSAFRALCGGYFIRLHRDCSKRAAAGSPAQERPKKAPFGIAVDPGVDFVETLYRAGYSLSDINMILVTHDHVDHAGALDTLVSLLHVRARTLSDEGVRKPPPVTILMSRSMDARYAEAESLRGIAELEFQCIEELMGCDGDPHDNSDGRALSGIAGFPPEFELIPMSTRGVDGKGHCDLSGAPAFGVCIRAKDRQSGGVAISSDTPAPPGRSKDGGLPYAAWLKAWAPALEADILVAHLSSVPLTELRKLSDRPVGKDRPAGKDGTSQETIEDEEAILREISAKLQRNGTVGDGLIEYGLWLRSSKGGDTAPIVGPVPPTWQAPSGQAFLRGILRWAKAYKKAHRDIKPGGLFIVGELSEELGTMRSKVAASINESVFAEPQRGKPHTYSLSGDIGLSALVTWERAGTQAPEVKVLCATCNLDTDRVLEEQYHDASDVFETCVKGENEGIFYNCREHAPSKGSDPVFLEQLERFDIFGR